MTDLLKEVMKDYKNKKETLTQINSSKELRHARYKEFSIVWDFFSEIQTALIEGDISLRIETHFEPLKRMNISLESYHIPISCRDVITCCDNELKIEVHMDLNSLMPIDFVIYPDYKNRVFSESYYKNQVFDKLRPEYFEEDGLIDVFISNLDQIKPHILNQIKDTVIKMAIDCERQISHNNLEIAHFNE